MEVIKKMFVLIFLFFLVGCNQDEFEEEFKNLSSIEILETLNNNNIVFDSANIKNLKTQELANRYGIATDDLQDGTLYYSTDENKSDCIIIAVAKDKNDLEAIERAFSSEIVSLTDSFKNNEIESKKIENHLFKTKNLTVILAISDSVDQIESIFDEVIVN